MAKDEMALKDVPKHARPEEFLTDAALAELYMRELAALPAKTSNRASNRGSKRAELEASLHRAKVAAALTDQVTAAALEGQDVPE